jgi:hypothetical protein
MKAISNDPMYCEFLEYKNELNARGLELLAKEHEDDKHDIFVYPDDNRSSIYFDDDYGDSWNDTPLSWNMQNSNTQREARQIR